MKKQLVRWILLFGLMISFLSFSACNVFLPGQFPAESETLTENTGNTEDAVFPQLTANTDFEALESDRVSDEELRRIWLRYDVLDSFGYFEWYLGAYQFNHTNLLLQEINGSTFELITKYDGKSLLYAESVLFDEENHAKKVGTYMYFSKGGELLASFDENGEPFLSIEKETVDIIGSDILSKDREKELKDFFSGVTYNEALKQYEYHSDSWDCNFKIKDGYVVYIDNNQKLSDSGKYVDKLFDFGTTEIDLPPVVASKLSIFMQPDEELQGPDGEQVTKEEFYNAVVEHAEISLFDCITNLTYELTQSGEGHTFTKILRRDGRTIYSCEKQLFDSGETSISEYYIVIAEDLKSYSIKSGLSERTVENRPEDREAMLDSLEPFDKFMEQFIYNDEKKGYEANVNDWHGFMKIEDGHVVYISYEIEVYPGIKDVGGVVIHDFGTTTVELPAWMQ